MTGMARTIQDSGVEPLHFRQLMRAMASSVAVITSAHEEKPHGMTATAVVSISADPPTLLIAVNRATRSHPFIAQSRAFVVNILAERQMDLSNHFAAALDNQFEGVDHETGWHGIPILIGTAAHLVCRVVRAIEVGTHTLFIGRVIGGEAEARVPLLYHNGSYRSLSSPT